ncbi:VWA domain-containing protein, partial [Gluconobacter kondonii]|nr:VWA domain-containing protein [Gluconobacter kondonii]
MMFDLSPMLPVWLLATLAALSVAGAIYGALRGARGVRTATPAERERPEPARAFRALHPVLRPVPQDALLVVDRSASMQVGPRTAIADQTARQIMQDAEHLPGLTLHRVDVPGGTGHGTRLFEALDHADLPQGRFAGAIVVTDGMDHDV